jgi:hypothetical protein
MAEATQDFERLLGQRVSAWVGTEMAAAQDPDAGPIVWSALSAGQLQFFELEVHLSNGLLERFTSQLDGDCNYFGLCLRQTAAALHLHEACGTDIFRGRLVLLCQ